MSTTVSPRRWDYSKSVCSVKGSSGENWLCVCACSICLIALNSIVRLVWFRYVWNILSSYRIMFQIYTECKLQQWYKSFLEIDCIARRTCTSLDRNHATEYRCCWVLLRGLGRIYAWRKNTFNQNIYCNSKQDVNAYSMNCVLYRHYSLLPMIRLYN